MICNMLVGRVLTRLDENSNTHLEQFNHVGYQIIMGMKSDPEPKSIQDLEKIAESQNLSKNDSQLMDFKEFIRWKVILFQSASLSHLPPVSGQSYTER